MIDALDVDLPSASTPRQEKAHKYLYDPIGTASTDSASLRTLPDLDATTVATKARGEGMTLRRLVLWTPGERAVPRSKHPAGFVQDRPTRRGRERLEAWALVAFPLLESSQRLPGLGTSIVTFDESASSEASADDLRKRWTPFLASTTPTGAPVAIDASREKRVSERLEGFIEDAKQEVFESGIQSQLADNVTKLVNTFDTIAVRALGQLVCDDATDSEVAAEVLRCVGELDDRATHSARLQVLAGALSNARSPVVRQGAALGLASLDDPATAPHLRSAISREPSDEVRKDLEQVLRQLEITARWSHF